MAQDSNSPTGFDLIVERIQNKFPHFLLGISLLIIVVIVFSLMLRNRSAEVNDLTQVQTQITPAMADATATPAMKKSIGSKIAEFFMPKKDAEPTPANGVKIYTVQSGDGLWNIADTVYKDGAKWTEIAQANAIKAPYMLEPGQKITLPASVQSPTVTDVPTTVPSAGETTAQAASTDTKVTVTGPSYVVREGECLWNIAESAYGDGYMYTKIAQANNVTNPDLIYPGQRFVLPRN